MFVLGGKNSEAEPAPAKAGFVVLPAVSPGGAGLTLRAAF
jgi:hypothetical protein